MWVLDSSIVIALTRRESGSDELLRFFDGALISAVNYSEVLQKTAQLGGSIPTVQTLMRDLDLGVVPFDDAMAVHTALSWPDTRSRGLSLADRACLSLAEAMSGVAVTTDGSWAGLELGVEIHLVAR